MTILVAASPEENVTQQHLQLNVYHDIGVTRNKIVTAQFECYQKIMKDNDHNKIGPVCNRTWDGWLCWDDTEAGFTSEQHCPDYFQDFDPSEMVTKICSENGHWFLHPDSNRTWTNYTRCNEHTNEGRMTAMNLFYLALIGHGLSLISLFISLGIFFNFNCKVSVFIHLYLFGCNYFWMLCEGIYLHTLIVVAVFAEKQHLMWYYLLGWGFPLIPASIHAIARSYYYNDNCWISSNTSLLYIIHGPICAALLVNLFFLLNIVRVLITKLKVTHQAESSLYMKAVRATLILVPLLGIQYVLLPYKPEERVSSEIYDYIMHILMHYQGLLVATIFCFFNGEVQGVLRRHWNQYRMQFGSTLTHSDAMRSASYTASSITDVQGCYSIDSNTEHLNGKGGCLDIETSILKSENPFA
uniref:Calcitonin receptor-like a n=1 Tax=Hucho hucho TaxID=62062 RepID=A0A4W5K8B8_9TELE